MNCLTFYEAMARQEYLNNPERAEELYKYGKDGLIKDALEGVSIRDISTIAFGRIICSYWTRMGLPLSEQHNNLLKWSLIGFLNKNVRPEFDEEYAELHWEG